MPDVLIRAGWIAPMNAPLLPDGAVLVRSGRIAEVGPFAVLAARHPAVEVHHHAGCLLTPALINAHCHLELSDEHAGESPAAFWTWLLERAARTRRPPEEHAAMVPQAVHIGVRQCIAAGVGLVCDISRQAPLTRPCLRDGPIRVISFGEVMGMGARREMAHDLLDAAMDATHQSDHLRIGISPHAPYTTEREVYERCIAAADRHVLPLATHLAETDDEGDFLHRQQGALRSLWDRLGTWQAVSWSHPGGPIRFARSLGLLDRPTLLAHVNYVDDDELALLAAGSAAVVYCPRTHAYFRHLPHRWRDMLAAGVRVLVGTDSCASSPDLNLLDDLRRLRHQGPEVDAQRLWRMVTLDAADTLGLSGQLGELSAGALADLALFAAHAPDPLESVLQQQGGARALYISGKEVAAP